jgi:hypothetical protein
MIVIANGVPQHYLRCGFPSAEIVRLATFCGSDLFVELHQLLRSCNVH